MTADDVGVSGGTVRVRADGGDATESTAAVEKGEAVATGEAAVVVGAACAVAALVGVVDGVEEGTTGLTVTEPAEQRFWEVMT